MWWLYPSLQIATSRARICDFEHALRSQYLVKLARVNIVCVFICLLLANYFRALLFFDYIILSRISRQIYLPRAILASRARCSYKDMLISCINIKIKLISVSSLHSNATRFSHMRQNNTLHTDFIRQQNKIQCTQ